jgi:hypothetical protein
LLKARGLLKSSIVYGLPKQTALSFLIGKQVFHVCFGEYCTSIGFDTVGITFEGKYTHTITDGREDVQERGSYPNVDLIRLLGKTVVAATVIEDGTVEVSFSHGDRLRLFDDSPQYESYKISNGDQLIVV